MLTNEQKEKLYLDRISICSSYKNNQSDFGSKSAVIMIIKEFNYKDYLNAIKELHSYMSKEEKALWLSNYTRMLFLLGNPEKIYNSLRDDFIWSSENIAVSKLLINKKVIRMYSGLYAMYEESHSLSEYSNKSIENKLFSIKIRNNAFSEMLVSLSHIINESLLLGKINDVSEFSIQNMDNDSVQFTEIIYSRVLREEDGKYKVTAALL